MRKRKLKILAVICMSLTMVLSLGNRISLADNIVERGSFGPNISWTLDSEGTMRVSGSGSDLEYVIEALRDGQNGITIDDLEVITAAARSANTVIVGEGITSIGAYGYPGVFSSCPNLKKIILPSSLMIIGGLDNNPSLTEVVIPTNARVTSVVYGAFSGCSKLTSITIPANVVDCPDMLRGATVSEVIYLPKKVNKETFNGSTAETIVFGENLSSINSSAFQDCEGLKNVLFLNDYDYNSKVFDNLPDVSIYRKHTSNQATLEEASSGTKNVSVPSKLVNYNVTRIGDYAFDSNKYVKTVKLPSSIEKIGAYAFYNCSKLNKITMNEGITSIGKFAFYGCNSLTSIKLPKSLTTIGERAFWNCYSLTTLTIPHSVTTIGANAFESCMGLTSITIGENSSTSVSDLFIQPVYAASAKKTKYITIKKNAFSKCKKLKKVVIGSKVKTIGSAAFYKCSSLKTITIKSKKLKSSTVGAKAFKGINKSATFKIPKSKLKSYKKILLKKGATKKMKYKGI